MYQELFPLLEQIKEEQEESKGRDKSFYLYLTLEDLFLLKSGQIEHVKNKIPYSSGKLIKEKVNGKNESRFVATNIELEKMFHTFDNKTTVIDMNKSWESSKKWFYRTIFPIMDFRQDQIDKLIADLRSENGVLHLKNNISAHYVDPRKDKFIGNFKRVLTEEEVFSQFNISSEMYYSDLRSSIHSNLSELYFNEDFLQTILELMQYVKEKEKKADLVIYIDFENASMSNREIYEFEHSIYVMSTGFLKSNRLSVKEEDGKKNIYGFVPLLSFDNNHKKTFKHYGRGEEINFLVSATQMMELYKSGLYDRYRFTKDFVDESLKGVQFIKKIAISSGETVFAEQVIRNDISDKLVVPELPFEFVNELNFQDKKHLFKKIRNVLFNGPSGFFDKFYDKVLDAEAIDNLKVSPGKVTNDLKDAVTSTHDYFKAFFNGNVKALKPMFPQLMLRIFQERITKTNMKEDWKKKDVKDLINLVSYIKQLTFGKDEVISLLESRERIEEIFMGNESLLDENTFYYAVGQLAQFYASKSKSKEKKFSLYDSLTDAITTKKLMDELLKMKGTYHHNIRTNDFTHKRILNAVTLSYHAYKDDKLNVDNKVYFTAGLVDDSLFYKPKEEVDENSTEETDEYQAEEGVGSL
ncbi:hypothetical protein [Priestia megaterium]|uniref:CRISPR-associated protein Csh1 n=1 Tax=Priestia megaterium TaxID=1404 RepID=A0A6M6DYT4_PRIMG|nr:hypothetical protein [Priestia megaterium]QJX79932.1 hypothetical protein FDZ14_27920 [Priestia megaterium]